MNRLHVTRAKQLGFSMVELMVAVTLGLLLLAALGQVFVGSRQAYRAQEGVGEVQENGRFAIDLISRQIRLAGFRNNPVGSLVINPVLPGTTRNDVFITGADNTTAPGRKPGTDILNLVYQGSSDLRTRDCLGNDVAANAVTRVSFFIDSNNVLRCTVNDLAGDNAGQPLLEGISNLQVLYGIDNRNCGNNAAANGFRYVSAAQVGNQWCSLVSVRILLTAESLDSVDPGLPNNGRLQRLYSATVNIRNAL